MVIWFLCSLLKVSTGVFMCLVLQKLFGGRTEAGVQDYEIRVNGP